MKTLRQFGCEQVVGGVQKDVRRAALFDPQGDFLHPRQQEGIVGLKLGMTDEAHLRELRERCRARWDSGFLGLSMQHRRLGRGATEQRARIKADAFDTAIQQQAIEHALAITLGKELLMPHFHGQRPLQGIDKSGQFRQALRREAFR
ncbi:hypothetical protein D3C84_685280 [compost metagenome]